MVTIGRKEKAFKVTDSNSRDYGRSYWMKEMDAIDGEAWATRAVLGLARSGIDVPKDAIESGGWGALLAVGFIKLVNLRYDDAKPLLEEMLGCVQFYDEKTGNKRPLILRGNAPDFEEIDTIVRLRWEVLQLHVNFSLADGLRHVFLQWMTTGNATPATPTSQPE